MKSTFIKILTLVVFSNFALLLSAPVSAAEPFIGEVRPFAINFCPRGWAEADGALLPIAQNTALFSLYGTTYGGDGRTTFALPDLRGRTLINNGRGPGLTSRRLGEKGGADTVALTVDNMPSHKHDISVTLKEGRPVKTAAASSFIAKDAPIFRSTGDDKESFAIVSTAGLGQAHENMPPVLVMRYCVALVGLYPSEN